MSGNVARRAGIPPFYVMDVWLAAAERQRTHGDLVNLSAGQPSVGAPTPVLAAAERALRSGPLGYTVALGIPELRRAIANSTAISSASRSPSTTSCSPPGPPVVSCSPSWPASTPATGWPSPARLPLLPQHPAALGCEVVEIECDEETRFQPTVGMLAELDPPVQG